MADVPALTLADLTEAKVAGTGAFDVLMRAMTGHLEVEFKMNRLRGADYANVYLNALTPILQNAVVFLLQKDEAANKANLVAAQIELTLAQKDLVKKEIEAQVLQQDLIQAQIDKIRREIISADVADAQAVAQTQVITAQKANVEAQTLLSGSQKLQVEAETLQLAVQKENVEAQTANVIAKTGQVATETAQMLAQTAQITAQKENITAQTLNETKRGQLLDQQVLDATKQVDKTVAETNQIQAQECLLKAQYDLTVVNKLQATAQTSLIQQKQATERAQTVETGVDENSVIGRQKALYLAQSDGFKRDSEQKAAKLLVDSWSVRRTTDAATVADATNMLNDATIGRAVTKLLTGVNA